MEIYPYCNQYRNFKPNKFIDITQHIDSGGDMVVISGVNSLTDGMLVRDLAGN